MVNRLLVLSIIEEMCAGKYRQLDYKIQVSSVNATL